MVAAAQGSIVESEGWLDNNIAERQSIGASPALLDISSLQPGLHWFTMRVKDDQGIWSPALTKAFIIPNEMDNSTASAIQRREVWFDDNVAGRQTIGAAPVMLDISSLSVGLHSLTMRVQNDLGYWSSSMTKFFIIPEATVVEDSVELVRYCYWFDDDVAHAVVGELPVSGKVVSGVIDIDMTTVPCGQHTISWIIGDSKGAWGFFTGEVNTMEIYNPRGDVNKDGEISIADVTVLISRVLLKDFTESEGFSPANADVNYDWTWNISDVTLLIGCVLRGDW
jgi:hypothetical protein